MKDNFSVQASSYARFRPTYPDDMLRYINDQASRHQIAWDVGTGNGQVAVWLADHFKHVYATDISENQLVHAPKRKNIYYQLVAAEEVQFAKNQFDLVTVGQAVHWFDIDRFYQVVQCSLKPKGVIALFGYTFLRISPAIDEVIYHLYQTILGKYWDEERRLVEQEYQSISFPFREIMAPEFHYTTQWMLDQLFGYLNTWSAVQHYRQDHDDNPVNLVEQNLSQAWGKVKLREVCFPMFLRLGKNHK
ncbi:MAG: class I SAM-dependent methyltransferase [Bacteroidota bacterium]